MKAWIVAALAAMSLGVQAVTIRDQSSDEWVYERNVDKMIDKVNVSATIWSTTKVQLNGVSQPLALSLSMTRGEYVAVIGVPHGGVLCRGCDVRVRFDDQPASLWQAEALRGSRGMLMVTAGKNFIERVRSSKRVLVEVPIYNLGSPAIEFKAEGLPEL